MVEEQSYTTHRDTIYVSNYKYKKSSCAEVAVELETISGRLEQITGTQKKAAVADAVTVGVGLVVFWPALFLLAATPDKKVEIAQLKGEFEALQAEGKRKKCSV